MEKIPYWEIEAKLVGKNDKSLPICLVEYQITPDRVTKNSMLNVGEDYTDYFYVNPMQAVGRKNGVSNPVLARPHGGRAVSLIGEEKITVGNNEYTVNVKGAGTIALMWGKHTDDGYNKMTLYTDATSDIDHGHSVRVRETGIPGLSYGMKMGKFKLVSLITNLDFDPGEEGAHRPIGGQDPYIAGEALKSSVSMQKDGVKMNFCPVLSTVEMDLKNYTKTICSEEEHKCETVEKPRYAQEIRLVPSNIRIDTPSHHLGILPVNAAADVIRQDLVNKAVDLDGFVENMVNTSKQIYFLPYFSRKENSVDRYNAYTFSASDVPADTTLDGRGNAFYTDLESIDKRELSKLELLLKTAGAVYETSNEGLPAFIYTLFIANQLGYREQAGNTTEKLKRLKEDYKGRLDGFLSPESYIRINPDDKTIVSHVELDGEGITVKNGFRGNRLQFLSSIIGGGF